MKDAIKQMVLRQPHIKKTILINSSIDTYIDKIFNFSTIIPYYNSSCLKGFIAYYSNDVLNKDAYLTMLIINKKNKGEGFGKLLLNTSITDLRNLGFSDYRLEVEKTNLDAIEFYKNEGFNIEDERESFYLMKLNLKEYEES